MTCDNCHKEPDKPRFHFREGKFVCRECCNSIDTTNNFTTIQTRYLKGYGHVSIKRLEELKRRVILPYEKVDKTGKGYYLGRIGENGKIAERHPTY